MVGKSDFIVQLDKISIIGADDASPGTGNSAQVNRDWRKGAGHGEPNFDAYRESGSPTIVSKFDRRDRAVFVRENVENLADVSPFTDGTSHRDQFWRESVQDGQFKPYGGSGLEFSNFSRSFGGIDSILSQSGLPIGYADQEESENAYSNGGDSSNSAIIGLQKTYDTPEKIRSHAITQAL